MGWCAATAALGSTVSKSPGKGKKGGKKRNPWSDSEEEDADSDLSDIGSDNMAAAVAAAARDRGPRRAAGQYSEEDRRVHPPPTPSPLSFFLFKCAFFFFFFFFFLRSPAISLGFTTFGWDFCVCDRFLIQPLR